MCSCWAISIPVEIVASAIVIEYWGMSCHSEPPRLAKTSVLQAIADHPRHPVLTQQTQTPMPQYT